MERFRNLLVGLAGSPADTGLIAYAEMLLRLGALHEVRFLRIAPPHPSPAASHGQIVADMESKVEAVFGDKPRSFRIACDVAKGPLLDRFLSFAVEQNSDLILVGHRPERAGRAALARRLTMKAPCSILMHPDPAPARLDRILAPIDFSSHSADSLRVAFGMALRAGARCLPLHVRLHRIVLADEQAKPTIVHEDLGRIPRDREQAVYQDFVKDWPERQTLEEPLFRDGASVAAAIHRTAVEERADLIVMPARGRTRSAAILLGSVADEVIMTTHVPLLAVKHFGAQMHLVEALLGRAIRR